MNENLDRSFWEDTPFNWRHIIKRNSFTGAPALKQESWRQVVVRYQNSSTIRSVWEITNSILPYFALLALMVRSLDYSYWLTLLLAVPTAGFLVRIFIIFHDCGHGSFFKSKKANAIIGFITGVLTLTPYEHWRHDHAIHHASVSNLDLRGVGDVMTLTVKEYLELPYYKKNRVPRYAASFGLVLAWSAPAVYIWSPNSTPWGW